MSTHYQSSNMSNKHQTAIEDLRVIRQSMYKIEVNTTHEGYKMLLPIEIADIITDALVEDLKEELRDQIISNAKLYNDELFDIDKI